MRTLNQSALVGKLWADVSSGADLLNLDYLKISGGSMKLIALALALFSFGAFANTLDCRENINGSLHKYQIRFENGSPTFITINSVNYPARGFYDSGARFVAISTETDSDVYEFSYHMDHVPGPYRFSRITLTTYYSGAREILCRMIEY